MADFSRILLASMGEEGDPSESRPAKKHEEAISADIEAVELSSKPAAVASSSREDTIKPKETCIHKVPHRLREVNEKAYEPNMVSIGPYHHGKQHLEMMEGFKQRYAREFAKKTKIEFFEFLEAMKPLENEARSCYERSATRDLSAQVFTEMVVVDGCFIVHLILSGFEDGSFRAVPIQIDIRNDLLLLENQLPFFVLSKLYQMTTPDGGQIDEFVRSALSFFNIPNRPSPANQIIHLLDLVHSTYHPSPQGIRQFERYEQRRQNRPTGRTWKFIGSATELEDAGISFFGDNVTEMEKEHKRIQSMFDIMFTTPTKVLKIPTLQVDDSTERKWLNYMAYEQFFPTGEPTYFVDYVILMDNLINTVEDVQLLCRSGIIDYRLGHYEAVAQMFNKLREHVYMSEDFYYAEIFDQVNKHCLVKWNKWKASLKKNYFHSPWSFISFLAALVLLLLTLLQTVLSILSYIKQ